MKMRRSKVLAKMRTGKVANCVKINLADSRVVDIAGYIGFDCVWLDMEHVPNSISVIEAQIMAGKMHDMDSIVRVKRGSYSNYTYPLELDAAGIMVPHLMGLKDAQEIVYYTRFHPIGRRPWDGGNADGAYCMLPGSDYMEQANRERCIIVQIEDPEPLDELEKIAQVEGIDMLFFGPADFSQGIGKPGQFEVTEISDARKRVVEVARKYGKYAGTVSGVDTYEKLKEMGYQYLALGADVVALRDEFQAIAKQLGIMGNLDKVKEIF